MALTTIETGIPLVTEDTITVADDYVLFLDGSATGNANKEQFSDVMTLIAGTGLSAASGVLNVDASQTQVTHVGALQAGSITSGFTSIDVGSGAISTTGTISAGVAYLNETANANMTVGLTINQGANDDTALALKSSDVAHAMTGTAEADTYLELKKTQATSGGALIRAFKDADGIAGAALQLDGELGEAADTTTTSSSYAVVNIIAKVTNR